jgi:hypothetical protein
MASQQKYVVPRFTDLALVVLSRGSLEVTARQFTLILSGGFIGMNIWPHLAVGLPLLLRVLVAGLPAVVLLPFGWITVAGRPLEAWLLVLLRYWLQPKTYTWRRATTPTPQESKKRI